jgi:ornithine cyclodeaminase/alanine dehydrogenase-like protein (mu-crystallin family)
VLVLSRAEKAVALTKGLVRSGIPSEAATSVEGAFRPADVVCCATHAHEPVVRRHWLRAGTHINFVGYNTAGAGKIDIGTIRAALLVVESRAAVLAAPPSGAVEIRRAIESGAINADYRHAEIGEVVAGIGMDARTAASLRSPVGWCRCSGCCGGHTCLRVGPEARPRKPHRLVTPRCAPPLPRVTGSPK